MINARRAAELTQRGNMQGLATHSLPYLQLSALVQVAALSGGNSVIVPNLRQPLARELGERARKAGYKVFLFTRSHKPEPTVDLKLVWEGKLKR